MYSTFKEVCVVLHLMEDDKEWDRYFAKVKLFPTGASLRRVFVTALPQGQIGNSFALWQRYYLDMYDDLPSRVLNLLLLENGLSLLFLN